MKKQVIQLIDEIFSLLKKEDFFLLEKILEPIDKQFPSFSNLKEKYSKNKILKKLEEFCQNFTGGSPFFLLGLKQEQDEKKQALLIQKQLLRKKIKDTLNIQNLSEEEKNFLTYIYTNL